MYKHRNMINAHTAGLERNMVYPSRGMWGLT